MRSTQTRSLRDDLAEELHKEMDAWKARVEDLEVQATLGRMELRDRLAPTLRRIEAKLDRIHRDVEELAEARVVDEEELGYSLKRSMAGLREDLEDVGRMC